MRKVGVLFPAVAALLVARSAAAEPAVELEMQLLGRSGGSYIGGSYIPAMGGGGLIGLPLSSHTVLMTGFELNGGASGSSSMWSVGVPLEFKIYIREPAERKLVPLVRLGLGYFYSSQTYGAFNSSGETSEETSEAISHSLQAGGSLGAVYFVTSHLGLGMDAGLSYTRRLHGETTGAGSSTDWPNAWFLDVRWNANLILRI